MTDEEMSEFAEMLADACAEFPPRGATRCPLAVAFGGQFGMSRAIDRGVPADVAHSFAEGFDGAVVTYGRVMNQRAHDLGRLFRELYL